ncbi:11211_t:CDS:10 [Entrophospora sp. SA101]|nr:11211_t:CDS:10 [Entrophospora sp. SA101]
MTQLEAKECYQYLEWMNLKILKELTDLNDLKLTICILLLGINTWSPKDTWDNKENCCISTIDVVNFPELFLRETPNRLYFDDYYKVFIVICTNSFEEIPNSVLKIVDPLNGKIIYEYSLFDQDNPNKCQTVYSITGWQSTTGRQEFRWISIKKSQRMSRLIKDSIMLNEDLAIGSDKCGNVFGLLYNEAEIVSRLRVVYLGYRSDNITYSTTSLSSSAAVIGCSLLGSVFLFVRVNLKSYKLLRVLQTILEKWPTTRPVLGNDNSKFRSDHNATKLNFVIDGEMVSQFLRLSKQEQFRIIEKHPELIKAGKIFIHGENWFYGKSEEVIMAKYVTNVEEKKEVGNDLMDEEEIDEMKNNV